MTTRKTRATHALPALVTAQLRTVAQRRIHLARRTPLMRKLLAGVGVESLVTSVLDRTMLAVPATPERARWLQTLFGREAFEAVLPRYRIEDMHLLWRAQERDLSALGKPTAKVGNHAPAVIAALAKPDSGLLLKSVQNYAPAIAQLLGALRPIFGAELNVNAYVSLRPGTIFDEHWDTHHGRSHRARRSPVRRAQRCAKPADCRCGMAPSSSRPPHPRSPASSAASSARASPPLSIDSPSSAIPARRSSIRPTCEPCTGESARRRPLCSTPTALLLYDRDVAGADALACARALAAAWADRGWLPYRLGIHDMPVTAPRTDDQADILHRPGAALDPARILAPGRYHPVRTKR